MIKKTFEFSKREQGQMMIDRLIADGELSPGRYLVSVGVGVESGEMTFWCEVSGQEPSSEGDGYKEEVLSRLGKIEMLPSE